MKKVLVVLTLTLAIITLSQVPVQAGANSWEHKMGKIINSYMKIRSQLAADSLEGVKNESQKIADAAKAIQKIISTGSHDPGLHKFHSQVDVQALGKHTQMLHGQDIQAVRKHFKLLSEPIKKYVDLFGKPENVHGEVYVYHCPMYPGNWLQGDKNIGNPYYGKKMLKCGSLVGESGKDKHDGHKQHEESHEHKGHMEGMKHKH